MSSFYNFNIFPLFAWTVGLAASYLCYSHFSYLIKKSNFFLHLLLYLAFYWPILIIGETLGYHLFNIHNLATAQYSGLPICDCLHAPLWMKAAYFLLGPIFFLACGLFKMLNKK